MNKIALLILAIGLLASNCKSKNELDNYLGTWAASDPNDSISPPVTIYKDGENYFGKIKNKKETSDVPLTYNQEEKYVSMGQEIRLYYLADSEFLKMNFRGHSENLKKINEKEAVLRANKLAVKLKADSIKRANPFKDYKNNDADIAQDVLKNKKF